MSVVEDNLAREGITLPSPAAPVANYVPCVITGSLLIVSGQLCFGADGKLNPAFRGKLGEDVSIETGQAAARWCAINVLAQARAAWRRS